MTLDPAQGHSSDARNLPALPFESWKDTQATLHMWTQIVGKVRLELCPLVNHWWNVALYVTARGLTTSPMPYGDRTVEVSFDFIDHKLLIDTCEGQHRELALKPQSVAEFYREFMAALSDLGRTGKDLDHAVRSSRIRFRLKRTPCTRPTMRRARINFGAS